MKILVCRRYGTTIRDTVFSLFKDLLAKWQLAPLCKINESDFRIIFPNGSEVIFKGLDDECKLLSLNNISVIWIEEAFEVTRDMFEQLDLRMRGKAANQQLILSFNPISKNHWLYEMWTNPLTGMVLNHSTYRDNPFLNAAYISTLEEMRTRNPAKARVFCDGEFGTNPDGLVLTNWRYLKADEQPEGELRAGCDFGFNDPTALVVCYYDRSNERIFITSEWVKDRQQLDVVADAIKERVSRHTILYCDAAEPRTIDYLRKQDINAKPCIKGPDSVRAGIAFLQNLEIVVNPACMKFIEELENFSYIKDKKTGEWTDDTTHEWSHGIDALRYAVSDIYTKSKLKSFNKSILGL